MALMFLCCSGIVEWFAQYWSEKGGDCLCFVDWKLILSNSPSTRSVLSLRFLLCASCHKNFHYVNSISIYFCVLKSVFIFIGLLHVCITALWVVSKIKRYINIVIIIICVRQAITFYSRVTSTTTVKVVRTFEASRMLEPFLDQ